MFKRKIPETTSASLHVMAMLFMLSDHLWATVIPGNDWLTAVGRLAFPIFAFLLVEGFAHTRNLKKYALRLLLFAILSEIPFNLITSGSWFYPFHQNVLWTFLVGLGLMRINESVKERGVAWRVLTAVGTVALGCILGLVTMVDYYHCGILMILTFFFFRGRKWWCYLGQLVCLAYINLEMIGGRGYEIPFFGDTVFLLRQGLALFALIPIWLYRGRQGYSEKWFRFLCYSFYPLHMLILGLICLGGFNG